MASQSGDILIAHMNKPNSGTASGLARDPRTDKTGICLPPVTRLKYCYISGILISMNEQYVNNKVDMTYVSILIGKYNDRLF